MLPRAGLELCRRLLTPLALRRGLHLRCQARARPAGRDRRARLARTRRAACAFSGHGRGRRPGEARAALRAARLRTLRLAAAGAGRVAPRLHAAAAPRRRAPGRASRAGGGRLHDMPHVLVRHEPCAAPARVHERVVVDAGEVPQAQVLQAHAGVCTRMDILVILDAASPCTGSSG